MVVSYTPTHIIITSETDAEMSALCRAFGLDSGCLPMPKTQKNITTDPEYDSQRLTVKIAHWESHERL